MTIHLRNYWVGVTITLSLLAGMIACKKTPPPAPIPITPLQTLVNTDSNLTLYHRMLLQANDTRLLADDSVTLLMPTNAAFRSAGYSEVIIDSLSATFCDRMVRYQYLSGHIVPDSAGYTPFSTLLGHSIYGMHDSAGIFRFNATPTAGPATPIGKALVYRLTGVIQSASDSLSYLLGTDSTLTFMTEVLLRTNLYDSVLLAGNYTLLAPDNNAFIQAGYDSIGAIDSADINTLFHLAQSQVLKGIWFTNSFPAQTTIPNLSGGSVTVNSFNGSWQFMGSGNPSPVNWLGGNWVSGNSLVVHKVDGIISP